MPALSSADDQPEEKTGFCGSYVGYAYVYDKTGDGAKTDVRLSIKKSSDAFYLLEMQMFEGKIARFSKVVMINDRHLAIDEKINVDSGQDARAKGRVVMRKSNAAGTIEVFVGPGATQGASERTMKFLVEKLGAESP